MVDKVTHRAGLLEPVDVNDFPKIAAAYVAEISSDFALSRLALADIRAQVVDTAEADVQFRRDYSDILSQQRADARTVVELMKAAAALGIAGSAQEIADALAGREWRRVRAGVLAALDVLDEADRLAVVDRLASADLLDRDACVCCGGSGVV